MFGKDRRLYDRSFDLNQDGKLNAFEHFVMQDVVFGEDGSGSFDEEEEELEDELAMAGLDLTELELMDEEERREALEDAGLDPDDYDFD